MDHTLILADLREQFGAKKMVLYAEELAIVLDRTIGAIYTLNSRGGLPVPCIPVGGRLAVSIFDVANWLAGNSPKATRSKQSNQEEVSIPAPKRRTKSMGDFLMQVRLQTKFLAELDIAIENQLEHTGANPVQTVSFALFDDQPDLFFVDANGVVLAYACDEDAEPPAGEADLEWLTWTAALAKPWLSDVDRVEWLRRAESDAAGISALVAAERDAILSRI